MKKSLRWLLAIMPFVITACTVEPDTQEIAPDMKVVTLTVKTTETKATISDEGKFAWEEDDQISVLATDGKYYVLTNSGENKFSGVIPESEDLTSIAVYPAVFENGSANDSYDASTGSFEFPLPDTYNGVGPCTNVPMVAKITQGADAAAFSQVGGLIKFSFNNVPNEVTFKVEFPGKNVVGNFVVDTKALGESAMVAGDLSEGSSSVVTVNYQSAEGQENVVLYVPVPTGIYPEFTIKALSGSEVVYQKTYKKDGGYNIERRKLLIGAELLVSDVVIKKVIPFFSDAKVEWNPLPDATAYAIYVDGDLSSPVKVVENATVANFGEFRLGTEHTVQVAPIYGVGEPAVSSVSAESSFSTAKISQINDDAHNKGATLVSVDWEDVSGSTSKNNRVYYYQLFDSQDTEAKSVYEGYTVDYQSQSTGSGSHSSTSWYGKNAGTNLSYPTMRMTMGGLEPAKTYYFRLKTIDETSVFVDSGQKNITVKSSNGASAYSELVPLTTEAKHVAGTNEILNESFDDITLQCDFMNFAAGLTPRFSGITSQADFKGEGIAKVYQFPWDPSWLVTPSIQPFNTTATFEAFGLYEGTSFKNTGSSLVGWTSSSFSMMKPLQGYIMMGAAETTVDVSIDSPALDSDILPSDDKDAVICNVTFKACPISTTYLPSRAMRVDILVPQANGTYYRAEGNVMMLEDKSSYTDASNYVREFAWQELTAQVKLAKGFKISVVAVGTAEKKQILVDDIIVSYDPTATQYDGPEINPDEDDSVVSYVTESGLGTDYDVYRLKGTGLGDFPIGHWVCPDQTTIEYYQPMKEVGINVVTHYGMAVDASEGGSIAALDMCHDLKMKYIDFKHASYTSDASQMDTYFAQYDNYVDKYVNDEFDPMIGLYVADEPSVSAFAGISTWASEMSKREKYKDLIPYVNLFPSYANATQLGASSYEEHVDKFLETENIKSLSFDFYPYTTSHNSFRSDFFYNLDLIRKKSLDRKIPFEAIISAYKYSTSWATMREDEFRWQVWASVAFGAKGISYFCYFQPYLTEFTYTLVDKDNNKGEYYPYAQRVNQMISEVLASKLIDCHADGVIQTAASPLKVYETRYTYGPLKSVTGNDSIVGCFHDDKTGSIKLFVMQQKAVGSPTTSVTLEFDSTVTNAQLTYTGNGETTNGTITDGKMTLSIPSGEAYLVELTVTK